MALRAHGWGRRRDPTPQPDNSATTGIGYDISVGDGVGITVYANDVRSFGAGTWVNGFSSDFVATPNVLQFGAALTVH